MAIFCYLLGDEKSKTCALIDPAFEAERIMAEVGRGGYRVTHVINTHGHVDHTAGNRSILSATKARLLIHERDAERLQKILHGIFSRLLGGKNRPDRTSCCGTEII